MEAINFNDRDDGRVDPVALRSKRETLRGTTGGDGPGVLCTGSFTTEGLRPTTRIVSAIGSAWKDIRPSLR